MTKEEAEKMRSQGYFSKENKERRCALTETVEYAVLQRVKSGISANDLAHMLHEDFLNCMLHEDAVDVLVCYHTDLDVQRFTANGITEIITRYWNEELERINYGPAQGFKIRFIFDSRENVEKNYRGMYYYRM